MDCVYRCVERTVYDENKGYYTSYGIMLEIEVRNVSKSKQAVEKLVKYLNDSKADPMHLDDIIEEYLTVAH